MLQGESASSCCACRHSGHCMPSKVIDALLLLLLLLSALTTRRYLWVLYLFLSWVVRRRRAL